VIRVLIIALCLAGALSAQTRATLRAVEYLAREVPRWSKENGCFSCHNNGDGARALYVARQRGYTVPKQSLADTTQWLLTPAEWDHDRVKPGFSDKKLAHIQFAAALAQAYETGVVRDRAALRAAAESLLQYQDADGSWQVDAGSAAGSPVTYGTALSTYMARHTLEIAGFTEAAARATRWLVSTKPHNILDAAALLLAVPSRHDCVDMILRAQSSDGGWGPNPMAASEPFDTAVVLLALHEPTAAARGRAFLIARQRPDGGWPETTRPPGAQSYAQHISTSAWATLALLADPER
jgi:Prenyltransferase and squalene oxidase repeat